MEPPVLNTFVLIAWNYIKLHYVTRQRSTSEVCIVFDILKHTSTILA